MYSAPSACTCLCLHFLLLCFQVQVLAAEENVDFRIHVENQTRARDDVSRKQLRLYQLYSRTSGKHIQVLGRRISARGEDGDKYAQLLVETDTFGSQVRIKGKETEFYLCMNRKGKLVGKPDGTSKECVFIEKVLENNYTALMSAKYSGCHLFIVRCKLSRDTAQGRCAPRNSLAPRLPTTDGLVQSSDPALLAVLEDAAIDLP
uniref:Fibroblast growth factor n=2 Tax=Canis lupus familiaris TaxID=9615 RepID=A0A8C0LXT9_CANLF|eukprot:XP_005619272.1 fibroblast growth factor 18 isoform X2 [Canis lupus familiaris]